MQKTMGSGERPGSAGRDETSRAVISGLTLIISQLRKSLTLIESEIASAASHDEGFAGDIVILDDLTPGYTRACAVLRECDAGLSAALGLLEESMMPGDIRRDLIAAGDLPPISPPASS